MFTMIVCKAFVVSLSAVWTFAEVSDKPPADRVRQPSVAALVMEQMAPLVNDGKVVGMSVGVVHGDQVWTFGLGRVDKDHDSVPTSSTVYEIGSISKVFTTTLLAEMIERGEVQLEEPVEALLPEGTSMPAHGDRKITLLDLATHASGLPRLPTNLPIGNPQNPYAAYTIPHLYEFLSKHELKRAPGERSAYSNLGMGLLGHALACRAGMSYEDLIIDRIAGPLQMPDTRVEPTASMRERMATPHNERGGKASNWEIRSLAGAGGLSSTLNDMIAFMIMHIFPDESSLGRAARATREPRRELSARGPRMGLGWVIQPDGAVWHNGRTGGYTSFAGFRPDRSAALVVLTCSSTDSLDAPALALLERLAQLEFNGESR